LRILYSKRYRHEHLPNWEALYAKLVRMQVLSQSALRLYRLLCLKDFCFSSTQHLRR